MLRFKLVAHFSFFQGITRLASGARCCRVSLTCVHPRLTNVKGNLYLRAYYGLAHRAANFHNRETAFLRRRIFAKQLSTSSRRADARGNSPRPSFSVQAAK